VPRAGTLNDVRGNDFSSADLLGASFILGVDLRAQIWPEDGDVVILTDVQERARWARGRIEGWKDRERRNRGSGSSRL
jgi:hypothetical protein